MNAADLRDLIHQADLRLIASRIKRARRALDLSHDRLAAAVGTSRQHLISLEKAKHRPRPEMLRRIAEATGREVEWFLDPDLDASPFQEVGAA